MSRMSDYTSSSESHIISFCCSHFSYGIFSTAMRLRVPSEYCRFPRADTEVTGTFWKHPAACGMEGDREGEARWRAETSQVFRIRNYR